MQVERETQDKIAHKNFLSYLNKHRLHSEYREWHSVNLNLKIIQCCLLDNKNRTIAVGMGKGTKKAPILGSEFEAIEHYIFGKQKHNIENKKIEDIVSQAPVMLNESVIKIILNKYKDISFNTTRFKAFNSHDYIDYPTILIDINWKEPEIDDNSRIYSYASDSGYASGSTENEETDVVDKDSLRIQSLTNMRQSDTLIRETRRASVGRAKQARSELDAQSHQRALHSEVMRLANDPDLLTNSSTNLSTN